MITLTAPADLPITTTLLKNPELSNDEALDVAINHRRAITGKRYSYVKSSENRRLTLQFSNVDRLKTLEVIEFVKAYLGFKILLKDHRGREFRGILEPFEVTTTRTHSGCAEACDFTLVFIGELIQDDQDTCNRVYSELGLLAVANLGAEGELE